MTSLPSNKLIAAAREHRANPETLRVTRAGLPLTKAGYPVNGEADVHHIVWFNFMYLRADTFCVKGLITLSFTLN